ncbi:MAG: hypothetical protein II330_08340 [Clostridia bacterium]|nr:hypothetical protein [Clostridia bacterium]
MDTSSTKQTPIGIKPVPAAAKLLCCIVLLICSAAIPALPYYIGTEGISPYVPVAILFAVLALCLLFILTLCRKPLFLALAFAGALATSLLGLGLTGQYAALLCGTVAGAVLIAGGGRIWYVCNLLVAALAAGVIYFLTGEPILAACALLPALIGLALGICYRKKYSIIVSVGVATGTLLTALVLLIGADALMAGVPLFSAHGLTDYIRSIHASVAGLFAESLQIMINPEAIVEHLTPLVGPDVPAESIAELANSMSTSAINMLGGDASAEAITAFANSMALTVLGIVPGVAIMLSWLLGFIAHRGMTAALVRGLDKKDYPEQLIKYEPSIPTAIFTILCFVVLVVSSLFPQAGVVVFIALNLVLALLPLMSVSGILSIISNVKNAPVKWPLLLTYGLAVIFLGVAVVPMIAFFGALAVLTQALTRALEQKFKDFTGGQ